MFFQNVSMSLKLKESNQIVNFAQRSASGLVGKLAEELPDKVTSEFGITAGNYMNIGWSWRKFLVGSFIVGSTFITKTVSSMITVLQTLKSCWRFSTKEILNVLSAISLSLLGNYGRKVS